MNIPNAITIFRGLLIPIYALLYDNPIYANIVFAVFFLGDFFDGYFARKLNQQTNFGKWADKIVDHALALVFLILSRNVWVLAFMTLSIIKGIATILLFKKYKVVMTDYFDKTPIVIFYLGMFFRYDWIFLLAFLGRVIDGLTYMWRFNKFKKSKS